MIKKAMTRTEILETIRRRFKSAIFFKTIWTILQNADLFSDTHTLLLTALVRQNQAIVLQYGKTRYKNPAKVKNCSAAFHRWSGLKCLDQDSGLCRDIARSNLRL